MPGDGHLVCISCEPYAATSAACSLAVLNLYSVGDEPVLVVTGAGQQQQPARFNQPISFVSHGTVGCDPMEIRPALQRAPADTGNSTPAAELMQPSDAVDIDVGKLTYMLFLLVPMSLHLLGISFVGQRLHFQLYFCFARFM